MTVTLDKLFQDKALVDWFRNFDSCLVAFSGGVDSAVLAGAAVQALGDRALAVCAESPSSRTTDHAATVALAEEIGIRLQFVTSREFDDPAYTANSPDRCYHCKRIRMKAIVDLAAELDLAVVVEGSQADDMHDVRPGRRAVVELGIRSPLVELGFNKEQVRDIARSLGLSIHAKPADPCLSTRLAYGVPLTDERLRRIEQAEQFLRPLGFTPLRVRMHDDEHVRIEVSEEQIDEIVLLRKPILERFGQLGFRFVSVDLEGFRSGKMNAVPDRSVASDDAHAK